MSDDQKKFIHLPDGTKVPVPSLPDRKVDIARTVRTAHIVLKSDEISIFVNEYGQRTPILIVGTCVCDGIEYAALYNLGLGPADPHSGKAYVVELVREKGQIKGFRDLDTDMQDEEWAVITQFFLDNNVYERNRINKWIWNTKLLAALGSGIPTTMLKRIERLKDRWEKKKLKR